MATKLYPFADNISQIHVVVENLSPETHRKHRHHIGIHIVVSEDKPIVVSHNTDNAAGHENLYYGIRIAFGMASRRLKHALGKRRAKRSTRRRPSRLEIVDEGECLF
jgi:DNA topoisomerase VI subunit B